MERDRVERRLVSDIKQDLDSGDLLCLKVRTKARL